jgi:uncharacterized membrane protein YwzB
MKKIKILFLPILFSLLAFTAVNAAILSGEKMTDFNKNVTTTASTIGLNTASSLEGIISTIIRIVLAVLGTIFLILTFMAGNSWMRADGNEEIVKKAKETIINLSIGLCLILAAYALSSYLGGLLASLLITK